MSYDVVVMGAGLAGCEAAWQLAHRNLRVRLVEQKPLQRTAAHQSDLLGELVCSNSLRSTHLDNAVGLLKEEMRRLGSLVLESALEARVPAGGALAVDRQMFSQIITRQIADHPCIERQTRCVPSLPETGPTIIATGPLTTDPLAKDIAEHCGKEHLYFYDAIAPIISGESIDREMVYAASRYGKGNGSDYLNCPLTREQYTAFVEALCAGESMPLHPFEDPRFFNACLPIEVVAARGPDTLRFGALKPVGLADPRSDRRPYAVAQLRREDKNGQAFNLVGFQTKLKHSEQRRIFRMIPGLERAEFLRLGAVHRNTYIDAPLLLDSRMRLLGHRHLRFAGQITGVEGYVESAAHGLITGALVASDLLGRRLSLPPPATALGALYGHVLGHQLLGNRTYEPHNVHWGMFAPPPPGTPKRNAKRLRAERARNALETWAAEHGWPLAPGSVLP